MDDTVNQHVGLDTNEHNLRAIRNRSFVAPLPDPITKNIEAITALHTQEVRDLPAHQRLPEAIATFFGRSVFLYILLILLAVWMGSSFFDHLLPFDVPPFRYADQGLDAAALLISTGVLVRQTRQENFAEQRMQLMLQLNLLSEQKIAKIIALLEELRTDSPDVINRHDPEAEVMQEAADPIAVMDALQETLAQEVSSAENNRSSSSQKM